MNLRFASAVTWLFVMVWASNFAGAFAGVPVVAGYLIALITTLLIAVDPLRSVSSARCTASRPSEVRGPKLRPIAQRSR
jgi:hypothetical protein